MTRSGRFAATTLAALLLAAWPAAAGTLTGVVRNGTTGKTAAGVPVELILLANGMQPVADTKADSQGRYRFDNAGIGQQPMLLRATFDGVHYYSPVPPNGGVAPIDINVYEPTTDPSAFAVLHHIVALDPQSGNLLVGEEFDIQNQTKPPKSFYRPKGSFEFQLPEGATLSQVEAWGPSGMPVTQGPIDEGHNRYAIIFPFDPGDNGVRLSYEVAYPSNQTTLRLASPYPADAALLLAPPAMKVAAEGFSPAGSEHGWAVYSRPKTQAGATLVVSLSGTGPVPPLNGQGEGQDQGQGQGADAQAGPDNTVNPVAQALPPRLDSVRWILIAGFGSLFLLGAIFLWWKSRGPTPVAAVSDAAKPEPSPPAQAHRAGQPTGEQALRQSVEDIKETLFRLELRRQAGTLAESDYLSQRQRLEKSLRDLVKG